MKIGRKQSKRGKKEDTIANERVEYKLDEDGVYDDQKIELVARSNLAGLENAHIVLLNELDAQNQKLVWADKTIKNWVAIDRLRKFRGLEIDTPILVNQEGKAIGFSTFNNNGEYEILLCCAYPFAIKPFLCIFKTEEVWAEVHLGTARLVPLEKLNKENQYQSWWYAEGQWGHEESETEWIEKNSDTLILVDENGSVKGIAENDLLENYTVFLFYGTHSDA